MALLVEIGHGGWMDDADLRDQLRAMDPNIDVVTRADVEAGVVSPASVRMAAVSRLLDDVPTRFENLEVVQKLGAGVETIVAHPALPDHVRVTRLKPDAPAREIAEWAFAYILQGQRNIRHYAAAQARAEWSPVEPAETPDTTVGLLGLGHIGGRAARLLRDLGYRVHGWSRSPKTIDGVTCHAGEDGLPQMLALCDYVVAILPSTPLTRDLFDAQMFAHMKSNATLLNAGRGDLIVEDDLVAALDAGQLGHAVLDVTRVEPLPKDSPLWSHAQVTITPHISGWHLGDALRDVVDNYRRLTSGQPLLHEVDRGEGY